MEHFEITRKFAFVNSDNAISISTPKSQVLRIFGANISPDSARVHQSERYDDNMADYAILWLVMFFGTAASSNLTANVTENSIEDTPIPTISVPNAQDIVKNCTTNNNCTSQNSECTNEQCRCKQYYFELNNLCVPGLGADCSETIKCQAQNSTCGSTDHCVCQKRFIFSNTSRCLPIQSFGKPCQEDEQCSCMHDTKCQLDNKTFKDIVCWNKQCQCQLGHHYAFKRNACVYTAKIGEQCSIDENCEKLLFAECYENKCVCKPNYFASEGECKRGLNADCIVPDECSAVEHAKCTKGKCKCEDNFVERSVELCVPVIPFGGECQYVEQCTSQTSNSTCEATKDGVKVCGCGTGQHHHASGCFQIRTLDEQCDSDSECFVTSKYDSVACVGNKCVCVNGFKKVNGTFCGSAGSILGSVVLVFFMVVVKSAI